MGSEAAARLYGACGYTARIRPNGVWVPPARPPLLVKLPPKLQMPPSWNPHSSGALLNRCQTHPQPRYSTLLVLTS
jgi:hypothetical protein